MKHHIPPVKRSQGPRPIPTQYAGVRFRSRLEARWAVFFDSLGIRWVYEPDGLEIDGIWYLPDFWLPDLRRFFEVKPTREALDHGMPKIRALAESLPCEVYASHEGVFPREPFSPEGFEMCASIAPTWLVCSLCWCECPACGELFVTAPGFLHVPCATDLGEDRRARARSNTRRLKTAYRKARGARFWDPVGTNV